MIPYYPPSDMKRPLSQMTITYDRGTFISLFIFL